MKTLKTLPNSAFFDALDKALGAEPPKTRVVRVGDPVEVGGWLVQKVQVFRDEESEESTSEGVD